MALTPGTRLGVHEVTAPIGEVGMGQRDVALKVLPDSFANDTDRLARFTREAQTLASLNHPNIAAIYGLEEGREGAARHAAPRPVRHHAIARHRQRHRPVLLTRRSVHRLALDPRGWFW